MRYMLLLFTLAGCASMPGGVSQYESHVDNVTHTVVEPGWLPGSTIKLGLHRSSDMAGDEAILIVATRLEIAQTVTVNIDGKKFELPPIDALPDIDSNQFFTKRFKTSTKFIKEMIQGKSVWVKVTVSNQKYEEGEFSIDQLSSAKWGFKHFIEKLEPQAK